MVIINKVCIVTQINTLPTTFHVEIHRDSLSNMLRTCVGHHQVFSQLRTIADIKQYPFSYLLTKHVETQSKILRHFTMNLSTTSMYTVELIKYTYINLTLVVDDTICNHHNYHQSFYSVVNPTTLPTQLSCQPCSIATNKKVTKYLSRYNVCYSILEMLSSVFFKFCSGSFCTILYFHNPQ